jgi:heat shock protein HslJ/pimeloyl-ACP methyl ester carboxylesterase
MSIMQKFILVASTSLLYMVQCFAQQPGFDKEEYKQMMYISARSVTIISYSSLLPMPKGYTMIYQSKPVGLDNMWDLWMRDDNKVAVISIRGTTEKQVSWLENFYAAMIPAKGTIRLNEKDTFNYQLSKHPQAAVHVGWMVGMAHLAQEIVPRVQMLSATGVQGVVIIGHSQGGAIAYLLAAHLHQLRNDGTLPNSFRIKTYCSAAPKPGNLHFAHTFEHATYGGWAFNVVNAADWVPETPISIQTIDDFNQVNPFVLAPEMINKQSFSNRLALNYVFGKLDKPTKQACKNYIQFLGYAIEDKAIKKQLPNLNRPAFYNSNHYVRTGTPIVLVPDEQYFREFPQNREQIFVNHFHQPYLYLIDRMDLPGGKSIAPLHGEWRVERVNDAFLLERYDASKLPILNFDATSFRLSGFGGCNRFTGGYGAEGGNQVLFGNLTTTKMYCAHSPEELFISSLPQIVQFDFDQMGRLVFLDNDGRIVLQCVRIF